MQTHVSFGPWLKQCRKALGMTQDELAEQVGCSVETISKIERNERRPSRQIAERLAQFLDLTPDERPRFVRAARARPLAADERDEPPADETLPAPPAAKPRSSRLPASSGPLIGRARELAEIDRLLADPDCRALTLLGPGGVGKTHLALQAAQNNEPAFADGAAFVALAPVASARQVAPTVASALGLSISGDDLAAQVIDALRPREMLLVLDNVEHLPEIVDFVERLLERAPAVKLLLTSRERLRFQSEWVLELDGLPIPDPAQAEEQHDSAVELFIERARRTRVGFAPVEGTYEQIVRICRLVQGLPLGIELAAAWVRSLTCREIADEIERNLDVLSVSARNVPERHRSLRAVFDHSWQSLGPSERRALRALSVFRGGFDRAAAERVCGAADAAHQSAPAAPFAVLQLLATLADKSLLRRGSGGRYDLHELVRQYAGEQLEQSSEAEQVRDEHMAVFVDLAEAGAPQLVGPNQAAWLARINADLDNLRAALGRALDTGQATAAARLGTGMWRFWYMRGLMTEGRRWLAQILELRQQVEPELRARLAHGAGVLLEEHGDYDQATAYYQESLDLRQQLGDQIGIARTLNSLGAVSWSQGKAEQARDYLERSLALRREIGMTTGSAAPISNLGLVMYQLGDFERAEELLSEALRLERANGDLSGSAVGLMNLGALAVDQGNVAQAEAYFTESLELFCSLGDHDGQVECLEGLAEVAVAHGQGQRAARLYGAAEAQRELLAAPRTIPERERFERVVAAIRGATDQHAWEAAWSEGRMLSLEQAVAYALSGGRQT